MSMKPKSLLAQQSGYTLVEILVALIVGSIMIGSASVIINSQTKLNQRGRDLVIANAFAEARTEAIRSAGYLSLGIGTTDITNELPQELKAPRTATLTVTEPSTGLKEISLYISYNDQGSSRTENYKTTIGELGVGQY